MIRSIGNKNARSKALYEFGDDLIKAQKWERAESTARSIEVSELRDKALVELAQGFTQAGQLAKAESLIYSINSDSERIQIMDELSRIASNDGTSRARVLAFQAQQMRENSDNYSAKIAPPRLGKSNIGLRILIAAISLLVVSLLIFDYIKLHNPIPLIIVLGIMLFGMITSLVNRLLRSW